MMSVLRYAVAAAILFAVGGTVCQVAAQGAASTVSAEEYIERLESNQTHATSIFSGSIIISDRFGERKSTFLNYNQGSDESLLEFTSAAELGQRVLRTADEIYLYYPDADEIIRLQGAALRESLLGSDISYEDMTGNRGYLDDYSVEIVGEETIDGNEAVIIELTALRTQIAYPRQRIWIDKQRSVSLKSEQYAQSGRLLKVTTVLELESSNGKLFPKHVVISDLLKRGSETAVLFEDIQLDVALPRNIFSISELAF